LSIVKRLIPESIKLEARVYSTSLAAIIAIDSQYHLQQEAMQWYQAGGLLISI
jgi:hypothetical protein